MRTPPRYSMVIPPEAPLSTGPEFDLACAADGAAFRWSSIPQEAADLLLNAILAKPDHPAFLYCLPGDAAGVRAGLVGYLGRCQWTDRHGGTHIRYVGGQEPCRQGALTLFEVPPWRPEIDLWNHTPHVALVYEALQVSPVGSGTPRPLRPMLDALWVDPLDVASWAALHDTLIDQWGERAARPARVGFDLAVRLAG